MIVLLITKAIASPLRNNGKTHRTGPCERVSLPALVPHSSLSRQAVDEGRRVLEPNEARVRTQRPRPHLGLLQARPHLCASAPPFFFFFFYKLIWSAVYFWFDFSFLQSLRLYANVSVARQFPTVIASEPSRTVAPGPYTTPARKHELQIRMHRTSSKNKKGAVIIHYIFAHGVVQPLLNCGREEQEQRALKITSTDKSRGAVRCITGNAYNF